MQPQGEPDGQVVAENVLFLRSIFVIGLAFASRTEASRFRASGVAFAARAFGTFRPPASAGIAAAFGVPLHAGLLLPTADDAAGVAARFRMRPFAKNE